MYMNKSALRRKYAKLIALYATRASERITNMLNKSGLEVPEIDSIDEVTEHSNPKKIMFKKEDGKIEVLGAVEAIKRLFPSLEQHKIEKMLKGLLSDDDFEFKILKNVSYAYGRNHCEKEVNACMTDKKWVDWYEHNDVGVLVMIYKPTSMIFGRSLLWNVSESPDDLPNKIIHDTIYSTSNWTKNKMVEYFKSSNIEKSEYSGKLYFARVKNNIGYFPYFDTMRYVFKYRGQLFLTNERVDGSLSLGDEEGNLDFDEESVHELDKIKVWDV